MIKSNLKIYFYKIVLCDLQWFLKIKVTLGVLGFESGSYKRHGTYCSSASVGHNDLVYNGPPGKGGIIQRAGCLIR